MPQTTLFYPCDTSQAAKISSSAILTAIPLLGIGSVLFVAIGFVFIVLKIISLFIVEAPQDSTTTTSAN
jgi:hypothetical protein